MYAPVALFVYSRLAHTQRTIQSLTSCHGADQTHLIIFSDGPKTKDDYKSVSDVRNFIGSISGFKSVTINFQQENRGLAKSIILGVTNVFERYERVIIIEDDLIFHKNFLLTINNMLEKYSTLQNIGSVTGYSLPINLPKSYVYDFYFTFRHSSWGWGTWKKVWDNVDWQMNDSKEFLNNPNSLRKFKRGGPDLLNILKKQINGQIDSWSIIFDYNMCNKELISVCPRLNLVQNTGFDGSGIHCGTTNNYDNEMPMENIKEANIYPDTILIDRQIEIKTYNFFKRKISQKIKKLFLTLKFY
jgi:hypothetical protein